MARRRAMSCGRQDLPLIYRKTSPSAAAPPHDLIFFRGSWHVRSRFERPRITPRKCAHLTKAIFLELDVKDFQIVRKIQCRDFPGSVVSRSLFSRFQR
jgi:hypothetical protein